MSEYRKVDKDTQIAYLNNTSFAGFGLWWVCLLLSALLPDSYISEDGRMWLFIVAMTYALVIIGSLFWSGYARKTRELVNADPGRRKNEVKSMVHSAIFGFVFMLFVYYLLDDQGSWVKAGIQALLYAGLGAAFTYLMTLRKPKDERS